MRRTGVWIAAAALLATLAGEAFAKTVRYELTATKGPGFSLMLNGGIPAPTLEFTEGDDAEIVVHNKLDEEVSIHWHGILLPPEEDGVAYVNTPPIRAGKTHTFRFKIRQHGTYWYHSHTALQEQKGLYGALVIHPKTKTLKYDRDVVVVLSDWSEEDADQIMANLRKDGDYYLYKKDSVRSWAGAIEAGALGTYLHNEWTRMGGMDLSDVGYDAFLINGKKDGPLPGEPGETVRIRIINAAASSYFYVALGQEAMKVVSADGVDIEPIMAKEILIGMAETYDVLFTVPNGKRTQLRATVQDVTGFASGWIGEGEDVGAPAKAQPNQYDSMDHGSGHGDHGAPAAHAGHGATQDPHAGHAGHGSAPDPHAGHAGHAPSARTVDTLTVDDLRSPTPTTLPAGAKTHALDLVLGGDMERYVWHLNGKAIHEDRNLVINEGDIVRFTFVNDTMMHHPMHLHGHFFRVLNAGGDKSPLKHTVDVPPHGRRTIEFYANEPGEWMLHCHNLYHMKTGMARVVKYASFKPKPEVAAHQDHDPHLHDHLYFNGMAEAATNHMKLELRLSKTWDTVELHAETRAYEDPKHVEGDLLYRRWFSNFFNVIAGASRFAEFEDTPNRGVLGLGYTLPMLVETDLLVDHRGKLRLDVEKRFQWTKTLSTELEVSFRQTAKTELEATLLYGPAWAWAVGLMVTEEKVGAGAQIRF